MTVFFGLDFSGGFLFILMVDVLIIAGGIFFLFILVSKKNSYGGQSIAKAGHVARREKVRDIKKKRGKKKEDGVSSWSEENKGLVYKRFGHTEAERIGPNTYRLRSTASDEVLPCPGCGVNLKIPSEDRPLTLGCPRCNGVIELLS